VPKCLNTLIIIPWGPAHGLEGELVARAVHCSLSGLQWTKIGENGREEGLHGVHKRLRRDKHPKNTRRLQEVQRKTGCHPKEANPKKASVRET
jgi:hypothetical protein